MIDDTSSYLERVQAAWTHDFELVVLRLGENIGVGAGHGVGWAAALADPACRYVWALEHDCEPLPDCLEKLLAAAGDHPRCGAMAARLSRDVNELSVDRSRSAPVADSRFTFNSTLFSRAAIERCGTPRSDLFCAREDWEFTEALLAAGFGIFHAEAWALHGNKGNNRFGIGQSTARTYYAVRNDLRLDLEHRGVRALPTIALRLAGGSLRALRHAPRRSQLAARWRACADALLGRMGRRDYSFLHDPSTVPKNDDGPHLESG